MAARAYANIPTNKPIHSSNQIKDLSLWLPETNKAVAYATDAAREHSVHGYFLRNDVQLDWYLVLSERHVDEDVADEDQHDTEDCKWKRFRVVVEILGDVHVVEAD